MTDEVLRQHLEQGKAALQAPPRERVHAALTVLPLLLADLDRVCLYKTELRDIRVELTSKVGEFRRLVTGLQRTDPRITLNAGAVQKSAHEIDRLLGRISELLGP